MYVNNQTRFMEDKGKALENLKQSHSTRDVRDLDTNHHYPLKFSKKVEPITTLRQRESPTSPLPLNQNLDWDFTEKYALRWKWVPKTSFGKLPLVATQLPSIQLRSKEPKGNQCQFNKFGFKKSW